MPNLTYQWQRDDGDISGASGSVFVSTPGSVNEQYTPVSGDVGHTIRLKVNDGITDYFSGWSDAVAATPVPPSGSLVPAPPSSYSNTGTVHWSSKIVTSATFYGLFHTNTQKIVRTSSGKIFCVVAYGDTGFSTNHDPSAWALYRSNDNGNTWSVVWDSSSRGDPRYGIAPSLQIDEDENLYVVANYYPAKGETSYTKLYIFTAASNWAAPSGPITVNNLSSGKWSVFLDQGRQWIWICYWAFSGIGTNLIAIDYNGVVKYKRNIFKAFTKMWAPGSPASTDLYAASAHYPFLWIGADGTVHLAWSSLAFESPTTSFYNSYYVYSPSTKAAFLAGTETWYGPTNGISGAVSPRTLPFCADDSSSDLSQRAFPIAKHGTEFISAVDSGYGINAGQHFNYNRLYAMGYFKGKAHFFYESDNSSDSRIYDHRSYANIDLSTHTIDDTKRRTPEFYADASSDGDRAGLRGGAGGGTFVVPTDMESRGYFVQTVAYPSKTIRVLRSEHGGNDWYTYATGSDLSPGPNGLLNVQASHFVGSDGVITGLAEYGDSPNEVYAFTVTPD